MQPTVLSVKRIALSTDGTASHHVGVALPQQGLIGDNGRGKFTQYVRAIEIVGNLAEAFSLTLSTIHVARLQFVKLKRYHMSYKVMGSPWRKI